MPEGVKEMIARRLAQLSETANTVLRRRERRRPPVRPRAARPAARRARGPGHRGAGGGDARPGLIREADELDRFTFAHALVRETLYEAQSASRRVRLHRRIGEALEAGGAANPAELAYHFHEGRAPQAVGYALAAAEQANAALAYEEAAEHYRRADDSLATRLALGAAELRAGDPSARATFAAAAEQARASGDWDALAEAALGHSGRHAEAGVDDPAARALLEEALERQTGDSLLGVRLRARLRRASSAAGAERRGARRWRTGSTTRARCWSRSSPATPRCCTSTTSTSGCALSEELLALAAEVGERELEALGQHWRIYDLLEAGRVEDARSAHRALSRRAAELRQPLYSHFTVGWEVVWAQMAGRVGDAERLAREAFDLGRRAQARDAETIYTAQVLILRRREDALSDYVSTIEKYVSENPALYAWRAILPMAHLMSRQHAGRRGAVPRAGARRVRRDPARPVLVHGDRAAGRDVRADRRHASRRRCSTGCSSRTARSSCRSRRPPASAPRTASSPCSATAMGDLARAEEHFERGAGAQHGVRAAPGRRADAARVRRDADGPRRHRPRAARLLQRDAARGRGGRDVAADQPRARAAGRDRPADDGTASATGVSARLHRDRARRPPSTRPGASGASHRVLEQAREVGAQPYADAPAGLADRAGGSERVARERLLARSARAAVAASMPEPRVGVADRPVAAERERRAGVEQVAHAERPRGPLRPEPLVPVAGRPRSGARAASTRCTPERAIARTRSSGSVSRCSSRCPRPPARAYASSVKRTAASPIVCVASWKPAPAKRAIEAAIRSGSGQNGVSPSPWVSGASSHAVPASITPSAKYFATPPRHSAPRSSRSASQRLLLVLARVRLDPQRHAQAQRQLVGALEVAQQLERLRARRPSRARRSARARSAAAAARRAARAAPASAARGAARRTSSCAPGSCSSPVGTPSTHTTSEPSGKSTGPVTCASSSARGEASALCRSLSRTNTAAPPAASPISAGVGAAS